jgi:large subunit ribosomal protein L23
MNIYSVILGPIESHKSRMLETGNVFTFRVANDATKTDIKKAFHDLYDRQVSSIQIAKNYLKTRNGKKGIMRRRASFKKAYVTLDKPITQLAKLHLSKD